MKTLEDLIQEAGGLGRFQILVMVMTACCVFTTGWSQLQMSYSGLVPDFYCHLSDEDNSTFPNETLNACSINGTTCSSYEFLGRDITIIREWDLVCDTKWVKATVTSLQMAGVLLGTVLSGQSCDVFGRRKTFLFFVLLHTSGNLVAAFSVSWEMFAALRFIIGIGLGALIVIGYPYQIEFLPVKWRSVIVVEPAWPLSISLLAAAAYVFHDWFYLHLGCGIIGILSIPIAYFMPESIRWLAVHGKIEEAEAGFKQMARINKKPVPSGMKEVLINVMNTELKARADGRRYTYLDVLKNLHLLNVTVKLWFVLFTFATIFYGISFGLPSFGGNLYLNIFLLTMLELPFVLIAFYCNNRIGRRSSGLAFLSLGCLASSGLVLCELLAPEDIHTPTIITLSLVTNMSVAAAWSAITTLMTESYPTVIRNLGTGLVATGSRVGGIVSPFLINLDDRASASYGVMTGLLITSAIVMIFTTETKGRELSDSVTTEKNVVGPIEKVEVSNVSVIGSPMPHDQASKNNTN